jgi:phosphoglucomutase
MSSIMAGLRESQPTSIAGLAVEGFTDYDACAPMPRVSGLQKEAAQTLPAANVLEFRLAEGCKVIIRPSGTEPKIKAYLFTKEATRASSEALQAKLAAAAQELLS